MKKRKEKKEKRERQHRVHRRAGPGWCACMCVCGVGAVRVGLQCDGQKHLRCSTLRQPEDRNSNSCRDARLQRCTPSDPSDGLPAPATGPQSSGPSRWPTEMAVGQTELPHQCMDPWRANGRGFGPIRPSVVPWPVAGPFTVIRSRHLSLSINTAGTHRWLSIVTTAPSYHRRPSTRSPLSEVQCGQTQIRLLSGRKCSVLPAPCHAMLCCAAPRGAMHCIATQFKTVPRELPEFEPWIPPSLPLPGHRRCRRRQQSWTAEE